MNAQKHALLNALDIPIWLSRASKSIEKTHKKLKIIGKPFSSRAEILFVAMLATINLEKSDVFFVFHDEGSAEKLQISIEENSRVLMAHHPDYLLRNPVKKSEMYQDLLLLQNLIN